MGTVRLLSVLIASVACQSRGAPEQSHTAEGQHQHMQAQQPDEDLRLTKLRQRMVDEQLVPRGIHDVRVLKAMAAVPRHSFVLASYASEAYDDTALPIEEQQTISQPYIVALMTELAEVQPGEKVLEVGTGSGYQAAILAELGAQVFSIEIVEPLADSARARLAALNYHVQVRHGDGYAGWPEHAPYDAILITAAPPAVPEPLKQQLAMGGKLVVPVGETFQQLQLWTRSSQGFAQRSVTDVRFVPMTGEAQRKR